MNVKISDRKIIEYYHKLTVEYIKNNKHKNIICQYLAANNNPLINDAFFEKNDKNRYIFDVFYPLIFDDSIIDLEFKYQLSAIRGAKNVEFDVFMKKDNEIIFVLKNEKENLKNIYYIEQDYKNSLIERYYNNKILLDESIKMINKSVDLSDIFKYYISLAIYIFRNKEELNNKKIILYFLEETKNLLDGQKMINNIINHNNLNLIFENKIISYCDLKKLIRKTAF